MKEQLRMTQKLKKMGVSEFKAGDFYVSFFKEEPKIESTPHSNSDLDKKSDTDLPSYVKDIMGDSFGDES